MPGALPGERRNPGRLPGERPKPGQLSGGSSEALADAYDAALLDLDGVVYVGESAVGAAPAALAQARERGMRLGFVTNNASRPPDAVAAHLRALGVPAGPADVVTSAQAAARVVAGLVPPGAAVLVVGGLGLQAALRERGLRPVASADDAPAAVVQGFAPELGWALLCEGSLAVARGLPWVAANLDRTIPTARGPAPGNGALVEVLRQATGRAPDAVAGKPELPLHRESVERMAARRPLVVGDRLDTDILGATRGGTDSLLVLSGVTTAQELLHAPVPQRPTYVAADVGGLLHPHPPVTEEGNGWRCGQWTARVDAGTLRLHGGQVGEHTGGSAGRSSSNAHGGTYDDPYDGLRAACLATWSAPGGIDTREALTRLFPPQPADPSG